MVKGANQGKPSFDPHRCHMQTPHPINNKRKEIIKTSCNNVLNERMPRKQRKGIPDSVCLASETFSESKEGGREGLAGRGGAAMPDAALWSLQMAALQGATSSAVLKFEPFILHVQCRTLQDAQTLVRLCASS